MALADTIEQIQNLDLSDIDRIGVWPLPVRILLWIIAVVLIFVGTYFAFIKEKNSELQVAENREMQLRADFERKAHEAANLEDYRAQMRAMEEAFEGLIAQLPTDIEVPGLLEDISEKATASSLNMVSQNFQSEKTAEFYIELPIEIKVQGSYHDFGGFVSGIAGLPRIVTLHDFTIDGGGTTGRGLNMTILAKTYRYKTQE